MVKVELCRTNDRRAHFYVEEAKRSGHAAYEEHGWWKINILNHGNAWHSPDAVFKQIPDGIYVFKE